ncbi:unnamed protein product [Nesidiocoris tenuis]|uniref:Uncharacterized protein n=1 Tax=Nesidiocoris tenuis TaxID=355587 RepID=A0A6H5GJW5_9HEMI|nr:unnamed protein product [Nesidiocoris tenuis]
MPCRVTKQIFRSRKTKTSESSEEGASMDSNNQGYKEQPLPLYGTPVRRKRQWRPSWRLEKINPATCGSDRMDKEMEEVIQRLSSLPPTAGVKRIKEAEKLGTSLADVCFALKDENLPELPYLDRLVEGRSRQKNFDSLSFILTKKVSCCGNILWFEKCNTSEYAAGGHRPTRSDAAKHYAIRKSQSKVLLFGILQCFRQLQVIFHTVWRRRVKILILSPPIGDHWRASNSRRFYHQTQ